MSFELFHPARGHKTGRPIATLMRGGLLRLNAAALALLRRHATSPGRLAVDLLYDREARTIGLRLSTDTATSYLVRAIPRTTAVTIDVKAFCRHFGIVVRRPYRGLLERREDGIFVLALPSETP